MSNANTASYIVCKALHRKYKDILYVAPITYSANHIRICGIKYDKMAIVDDEYVLYDKSGTYKTADLQYFINHLYSNQLLLFIQCHLRMADPISAEWAVIVGGQQIPYDVVEGINARMSAELIKKLVKNS